MDTRPRVGLDLDGVIYRWQDTFAYLAKTEFGKEIDWTVWVTPENSGLNKSEWNWMWTTGVKERGMFRHGSLFKGAADGVKRLSRVANIVVITSRPQLSFNDTLAWLAFQRFPVVEIHMLDGGLPKSAVPVDYYIDDGPANIQDIIDNTDSKALLWDRPWNQNCNWDTWQFRRISSWDHVMEEFN